NVVESDCVKNFKLVGGVPAASGGNVHHRLENNYFLNTRNGDGNEITNFTWRSPPGGLAEADRNVFAPNSLVSTGNANGIYLRDDLDNENFVQNCVEVQNPDNRSVFHGAIMTSSGSLGPTQPSGLRFIGNWVFGRSTPALGLQGYEEDPV